MTRPTAMFGLGWLACLLVAVGLPLGAGARAQSAPPAPPTAEAPAGSTVLPRAATATQPVAAPPAAAPTQAAAPDQTPAPLQAQAPAVAPAAGAAPAQAALPATEASPADDAPQAPVAVAAATAAANSALRENADQYCSNIVDAAADARFARQAETLNALEAKVAKRISELETKRAEYETWLARREAFLKKADENLVAIYSRMRPDAAAAQMAMMDDETAAAILMKLNPRGASAILNEMEPAQAAQLSNTMAGAARRTQPGGASG